MKTIQYENLAKSNQPFMETFKQEFEKFLLKGWYILGEEVQKFEEEFAHFVGSKFCIGVASGLDALTLSLRALDLPPDSEIITPSNTYIATILAILHNGHTPILVEPDLQTYNITSQNIEPLITPKTKVIMLTHLYGKTCKMDSILSLAKAYDLHIIEDCAQSHGSKFKDKMSGSFGIGCFSFYPTKNLGALGDGGAITTDDETLAHKLKALRNYGSDIKYKNDYVGINSRLDELQACFLRHKLKMLDSITTHKRTLASVYFEYLDSKKFILPLQETEHFDVFHIFNIRHEKRDELKAYLLHNGIQTDIHYPIPPHQQIAMRPYLDGNYPISEEIHATTLSLPIALFHTPEDIKHIAHILNQWRSK